MSFRTTINIPNPGFKISYNDPVMFLGSCFSNYIGDKFRDGFLPVSVNPAGTLFNPASVAKNIDSFIGQQSVDPNDIAVHNGKYFSLCHSTSFSGGSSASVSQKVNNMIAEASAFLSHAGFLFITLGTARVYRYKKSGLIAANCHKLPSELFSQELLTPEIIISEWTVLLEKLQNKLPQLKIIFTVSPVRHWKDGPYGNQVSKSVLFLVIDKLLNKFSQTSYFPSYEIMMDDLRDYRFYSSDMLHPSETAIDYIWEKFCETYFDVVTKDHWNDASEISRAMTHRIRDEQSTDTKRFIEIMLGKIKVFESKVPSADLRRAYEWIESLNF